MQRAKALSEVSALATSLAVMTPSSIATAAAAADATATAHTAALLEENRVLRADVRLLETALESIVRVHVGEWARETRRACAPRAHRFHQQHSCVWWEGVARHCANHSAHGVALAFATASES
jgi:hypothetical protein